MIGVSGPRRRGGIDHDSAGGGCTVTGCGSYPMDDSPTAAVTQSSASPQISTLAMPSLTTRSICGSGHPAGPQPQPVTEAAGIAKASTANGRRAIRRTGGS
jgi:hypothetical protein